jgi:hypothetical protein
MSSPIRLSDQHSTGLLAVAAAPLDVGVRHAFLRHGSPFRSRGEKVFDALTRRKGA